jgi:hypothetical protein
MYVIVGVIGVAVLLYSTIILKILAKPYNERLTKLLARTHLLLMSIGTTSAMGMLMYAGFIGGPAILP